MTTFLYSLSTLQGLDRSVWSYLLWIAAAAVLGYAIAALFSGWLKLPRSLFLVPYAILAGLCLYAYWQWSGVSLSELAGHNWIWAAAGTALLGLVLARNVLSQPASPRPTGLRLAADLLWSGLVYGGIDALFLSVLPVLAARQAFTSPGWAGTLPGKILTGGMALLLSLLVTACYHWGFREYRAPGGLAGPSVGNAIMSLGYLLTGNPLTAVFSHVIMHVTGVLHGPASVMQLPPHYSNSRKEPTMTTPQSIATPTSTTQPAAAETRASAFLLPIFKLPLVLYRLHLGWLFGHRFLNLTHVGRKSGKVRQTVLAVLSYDAATKEIKAVSAWKASEWYKNIRVTPALAVETGLTRYAPQQRELPAEEIAQLFVEYCKEHPIFSRIVCRIPGWKWDSTYDEFVELARTLRGVAFRPQ